MKKLYRIFVNELYPSEQIYRDRIKVKPAEGLCYDEKEGQWHYKPWRLLQIGDLVLRYNRTDEKEEVHKIIREPYIIEDEEDEEFGSQVMSTHLIAIREGDNNDQ